MLDYKWHGGTDQDWDTHLAIDTVDIIDIISTTEQRSVTSGPAGSTAGCGGA